jgi:outer membrane protein OmpA-like peptidoglycan-associated protein/pimeloyl-ACP methyl ester carboxylesterase
MVYENIFFRSKPPTGETTADGHQEANDLVNILTNLSGVTGNKAANKGFAEAVEEEMESFLNEMTSRLPAAREKLNRWLEPYKKAMDELAAIDLGTDDLFDDSISITDSRLSLDDALGKVQSAPGSSDDDYYNDIVYEQLIVNFSYKAHDALERDEDARKRLEKLGYSGRKVETPGKDVLFELWVFTPIPGNTPASRVLLGFEGSDEIWDWLDDLNPTQGGPGGVQIQYFKELIEREIGALPGEIDLGGHSLGGALAQYAATLMPDKVHSVVTFQSAGIPEAMLKNKSGSLPSGDRVRHYRATGDIVPLSGESFLPGKVMIVTFLNLSPVGEPHTIDILRTLEEINSPEKIKERPLDEPDREKIFEYSQIQYGDILLRKRGGAPKVGETLRRLPMGMILGEEEMRRFGQDKKIEQIFKDRSTKEDTSMKFDPTKVVELGDVKADYAYEKLAKKFAYLSKLSENEKGELLAMGYTPGPRIIGASSFALWVFEPVSPDGNKVLAFEGSADLLDWLDDLNPDQAGPGYKQMKQNTGLILDTIKENTKDGKKVVFTGHSLGGALAQFAASLAPDRIERVVTFQSPGVPYDKVSRFQHNEAVIHYFVDGDIVPLAGEAFLPGKVMIFYISGLSLIVDPHTVYPLEIFKESDKRITRIRYGTVAGKRDGFPRLSEGLRQYIGAYIAPLNRTYLSVDLSPPKLYRTAKAQSFTDRAVGFVNLILDDLYSQRLPQRLNELADIVEYDLGITAGRLTSLITRVIDKTIERLAADFLGGQRSREAVDCYALSRQLRKLKTYVKQQAAEYPTPEFNRELAFSQFTTYLGKISFDKKLDELKEVLLEYQKVVPEILPLAMFIFKMAESQTASSEKEYSWYLSWFMEKAISVGNRFEYTDEDISEYNPEISLDSLFGNSRDDLPVSLVNLEHWTFWSRLFSDLFKGFLYVKQREDGRKISPDVMAGYNFFSGFSSLAALNRQAAGFIKTKNEPLFQLGMAELLPITGSILENPPRDLREWIGARWPHERRKKNQGARLPELAFDLSMSLFTLLNSEGESHTKVKGFTQAGRFGGALLASYLLGRPAEKYKTGSWNVGWNILTLLAGTAATFSMEVIGWLLAGAVSGKLSLEYWKFDASRLLSANNAYGSAAFQSFFMFSEIWEELWDGNTEKGTIGLRKVEVNGRTITGKCRFMGYPAKNSPYKLPFKKDILDGVFCLQGHMGFESNDFRTGLIYAVDFMLPGGTEIRAMRGGKVFEVNHGNDNPRDNYIVIEHNPVKQAPTLSSEPVILENILFNFARHEINEEGLADMGKALSDLYMLLKLLQDNPSINIKISAHTDNRGSETFNEGLSERRAQSTKNWLVEKGISSGRIEVEGIGESDPLVVKKDDALAKRYSFLKEGGKLDAAFIAQLATDEEKEIAHMLNRRSAFEIIGRAPEQPVIQFDMGHKPDHDRAEDDKDVRTFAKYFGAEKESITLVAGQEVTQGDLLMTLGKAVKPLESSTRASLLSQSPLLFFKPDHLRVLVYAENIRNEKITYPTIPFVFSDLDEPDGVPRRGRFYIFK